MKTAAYLARYANQDFDRLKRVPPIEREMRAFAVQHWLTKESPTSDDDPPPNSDDDDGDTSDA